MAFWGVEVKPKKPFRLKYGNFEGPRLHLSQATLGSKISKERTIVRCRVGDGPVVYLCSLLPGAVETCSMDLYFADDVIFSVKGSTSVHLVGYYEGTDFEDDYGEDVEDDGYSDEEDEEVAGDSSLDDFIVHDDSEDEDLDYDGEGTSDEDEPIMVPNLGVTIEEVTDEDPPKPAKDDSKKAVVSYDTNLVLVKRSAKKLKQQKDNDGSSGNAEYQKDSNREGPVANQVISDKGVAERHASSSEDEDGFRLTRKRKHKEADDEQHSKEKSTEMQVATPEPTSAPADDQEIPLKSETDSKKAKKKKQKKKKGKNVSEQQDPLPSNQANGLAETPFKQGDNARTGDVEEHGTNMVAPGSRQTSSKKGTVRKHPNGLEIENVSMGKPDGKQAQLGKKVGMIYIGKLKSNGKIFDSNIGKKPFFFRLGVGDVIKGWDIGVNGMRVGDKRRLTIPPDMGYGRKGVLGIPPNSWLVFDVELVEVK